MLKVRLFGRFSLEFNEQNWEGFESTKARELFSYLLCQRDRPHTREALAEMFWGESSTAQSKKYLRQTLWQLQTMLNRLPTPLDPPLLQVDADWVRLNGHDQLWLDVACFEQSVEDCSQVAGSQLQPEQAQALRQAVALYHGELLASCYQDWCLYERERLHGLYLGALNKLMSYCEAHHEYSTGIMIGGRMLRDDCASERTHRRLMQLYYLAGDRTAALRQYARCVAALRAELNVPPSKATVTLYEQICADSLTPVVPAHALAGAASENAAAVLPLVLSHLKQIQQQIAEVQQQVQQEIQIVETKLGCPR